MTRAQTAVLLSVFSLALSAPVEAAEPETRWTAATPDEVIDRALSAAKRGGRDALARMVLIHAFDQEASFGKARAALADLARGSGALAQEARWLGLTLEPQEALAWPGRAALRVAAPPASGPQAGLVRTFAVVGPFEDTGGGLLRREGPEVPGHRRAGADYSWGVYAVRPRRSFVATVGPRGLPLDLYIHPRLESCTYLESVVTVPAARPIVVRVASSGSFRLSWDGSEAARQDEVHEAMLLDRAAVRIEASAGEHLLSLKVCTGARPDSGRVRVRFTDGAGRGLPLATSSDLAVLDRVTTALRARSAAPRFERIRTPFEQSIDAAAAADQALVAAVLRSLAGGDDLRSSKTPGLLDRVASGSPVSPDRLAMAGFLSGFGANKSGWLARAAARAGDDAATASFAQRALVAARLEVRLVDAAHATANVAPLAASRDVHARWLRAQILAQQGGNGLRHAALAELRRIVAERGARTPLGVWESIAELGDVAPAAERLGALQRLAESAAESAGPALVAAHRMMGGDALEAVAMRLLVQQTDARGIAAIGEQLFDTGRYRAAREAYALAAELSPNRPEPFEQLTRLDALLAARATGERLGPLARAAELEPAEARLAAELAYRRGMSDEGPELGADAQYLVKPEVFLARARKQPAPDGVFDRQLHWRRVVRFHADKRVSQLMHYAREIVVVPRTEGERYENLPGGRGTELVLARVHKKDGSLSAPEEQDAAGPMVRWPKLERGDVVEIAVREWTPGPVGRRGDPPFYFFDYAGSVDTHPALYNEVVIDAPLDSPLSFDVVGGKPDERRQETRGGRRVTHLVWNDPPIIADEPWSPHPSELVPMVVGSVYPSWKDFLAWYRGAVEGFTTPDEQIERIAQELTAGKASREAKIEALFNFVADDIRYVNYVSGEWWLPNRPQQLLARQQGDCDDKAMLLISLLRAVGIDATEVLIQTRMTRQRSVMRGSGVAIPMFDHGIIHLPGKDGGRYLDATSPQSRIGSLPAMDGGALALHVGEGEAALVDTPLGGASQHGIDGSWSLTLSPDGSGALRATELHVGDAAFRLRNHLREVDARAQWVEQQLVAGWFDSVRVEPQVEFDGELPGGAARVAFRARSGSVARREGDELVVVVAPSMPITAQLAPLTQRTLPVELPPQLAPQHRRMRIEISAPAGYAFAELPPDAEADGGRFGKASTRFSKEGNKVILTRALAFEEPRIPVADYTRWRRWLQSIDRMMQLGVRLVPRR